MLSPVPDSAEDTVNAFSESPNYECVKMTIVEDLCYAAYSHSSLWLNYHTPIITPSVLHTVQEVSTTMEQPELIHEPMDDHARSGNDSLSKKEQPVDNEHETKNGDIHAPLPPTFRSPTKVLVSTPDDTEHPPIPDTSFASEADMIEKIEKELRGIKDILDTSMKKAVIQLSRRQIEMERWFKLAAAQGMPLEYPVTVRTEILAHTSSDPTDGISYSYGGISQTENENADEDEIIHSCGGISQRENANSRSASDEHFPRLEVTASGFLQVKSSPTSPEKKLKKGRKTSSPEESKSGASLSTSSKIDRIRKQEGKIRELLLGMKESINPGDATTPKKKPTINDCLGLTEFYSTDV